jgi:hypothetical protein
MSFAIFGCGANDAGMLVTRADRARSPESREDFVRRVVGPAHVPSPEFGEFQNTGRFWYWRPFSCLAQTRRRARLHGLYGRGVQAEVLREHFPRQWVLGNLVVERGLRDGRVLDFAVPVPTEADQVDQHVALELPAVFGGNLAGPPHGFGRFRIHVDDRHRHALRRFRRKARAVQRNRFRGEPDQIVDDDMDGSADGVVRNIGEVDGLRRDALAREGGVAVERHRQDAFDAGGTPALLARARAPHDDAVDGLQVARVGRKVDLNVAPRVRNISAGRADVILDVAAAQDAARIDVLDTGENVFDRQVDDALHHVQAAAVAHGDVEVLRAQSPRRVENRVEQRNYARDAFHREALAANVFGVQELLEQLGLHQAFENPVRVRSRSAAFDRLAHPIDALAFHHVHELEADGPAVDRAPRVHFRRVRRCARFHDIRMLEGLNTTHRVEVGLEIAPASVRVGEGIGNGNGDREVPGVGDRSFVHSVVSRISMPEP